jgi:tetratricopeptide (TPR) repeat protein
MSSSSNRLVDRLTWDEKPQTDVSENPETGFADAMISAVERADEHELELDAADAGEDLAVRADLLRTRFLARVAEHEFGDPESGAVKIGRYPILRRLGAGGMGVVYAAYDEALDRRLAIKVLHDRGWDVDGRRRERLIREAQAMARVTHPNLVTVHEVGSHDNQLFIAMEFVSGPTLKQWCDSQKRSWREIIGVFIQIAEGLAALHDEDLVHRDVKPANVIIGDDGRVRVLDLGLVGGKQHESTDGELLSLESESSLNRIEGPLTMTGERLGTPAYMSREQFLGLELTPASDIFAFSVVLYEALYGIHPYMTDSFAQLQANIVENHITPPPGTHSVPAWLGALVVRGLAPDPRDRPASMRAYAAALARDPSRTRRRWFATVAVAALAGLAGVVIARPSASQPEKSCDGAELAIAEVWDGARASEIRESMLATNQPYAEVLATHITDGLDEYAREWAAAHSRICEEHARGDHSAALLDARMACLHRRRQALAETVSLFLHSNASVMEHAGEMVARLPRLEACDDLAALSSRPQSLTLSADEARSLESKLARVDAQVNAGQFTSAIELARGVAAEAKVLDYKPFLAEALLAEGRAAMMLPDSSGAVAPLERAIAIGITEELDTLAAEAMIRRVYLRGLSPGGTEAAIADLPIAEAMVERSGRNGELRALLENNAGTVYLAAGKRQRAYEAFERLLEIVTQLYGEDHLLLALPLGNLAIVTSDERAAAELHRRKIDIYERHLGPEHPLTLDARFLAAVQISDPELAVEALAEVCPRWLGSDPRLAGECEFVQGRIEYARGRLAAGRRVLESARRHLALEDDRNVLLDGYLALGTRKTEDAVARLRGQIAKFDERGDHDWWMVLSQAEHRLLLAWLLTDPKEIVELLERAIVDLERIAAFAPPNERERLRALASGALAQTFHAAGNDRWAALAADARRFYQRWDNAYILRIDELDALSLPPSQ